MKGFLAFGALLAVILLGLGLWTASPMGGGGLFDDGGAGQDLQDREQGPARGVVPQDRDGADQQEVQGRVEIVDGRFGPATVEVPPESVVTFINRDDVPRGIDFEDDRLRDAEIRAGGAHTVMVSEAGRFPFTATGDSEAAGEIVVGG